MYKNVKCDQQRTNIFEPQPHQQKVVDYFLKMKYRGLLLYHALGSGKSCTSILSADSLILQKKKVYVFSPASLRKSFVDEYCKVCGKHPSILDEKFVFLSYNYSGVIKLLPKHLNNSVIIVDEVHNLINGKRNNSQTLASIYDLIYNSKNSKILLLSGIPIKKIYDVPLLINLMKPGTFKVDYINGEIFDEEPFNDLLKSENVEILDEILTLAVPKSEEQFLKFFEGVISYVPGADPKYYPKRIDMPIQKSPMSKRQSQVFYGAVNWENQVYLPDIRLKRRDPAQYALELGKWQVAHKKLFSRASSNFMYPSQVQIGDQMIGFNVKCDMIGDDLSEKCSTAEQTLPTLPDRLVKEGGWIHHSIFVPKKLSTYYSPKIFTLLSNISDHLDGKHMIYSALKSRSGVYLVRALLEMCGINTLVYSGDLPSDKARAEVLTKFNSTQNLRGEKYKVILLTEAGGEGLTLKAVKNVHILESDRNEGRIQQVIGRAIRYKSHEDLPPDEKYCRVWRYFSVPYEEVKDQAEKQLKSYLKSPTKENLFNVWSIDGIDSNLYIQGVVKEKQKDIFLDLMKQASV